MQGITVGVPVFNGRNTLPRALDSILSQTVKLPIEVIIVDDGSTDTSANIALSYELLHPNVFRLIRTENRGVAAARNLIVSEARYDHLTWLDADDYYYPTKLAIQHETLSMWHMFGHSHLGDPHLMTFSNFDIGNEVYSFVSWLADPIKHILTGEFRAYLWASMVSTEAYRTIGPFNEVLHRGEDTDWLLRFLLQSPRLIVLTGGTPQMKYHFSTDRDGKKVEDGLQYMLSTYGDLFVERGVMDEFVPRRYWEISNFYHRNKAWNEMWRCRAIAAKMDPIRYENRLKSEIAAIPDRRYRSQIRSLCDHHMGRSK